MKVIHDYSVSAVLLTEEEKKRGPRTFRRLEEPSIEELTELDSHLSFFDFRLSIGLSSKGPRAF